MASYYDLNDETGPSILSALPVILWQRRWLIVIPAIFTTIAGVGAAYLIPPMYESSATVLIESQQLPREGVDLNALADLVDQRIARARARVLSRQVLIQIIRANGLYPKEQKAGKPFSEIVDQMRDATSISGVASDGNAVAAAAAAANGRQTIALRIAFDYPDPQKSQAVAQQFVNRFLEVDATAQTEQAQGAATFLTEQEVGLRSEINDLEDKITKIKQENGSLLALQSQSTGNPIADASRIDADISRLQSENTQLSAAQGSSGTSVVADAERTLRELESRLSDTHPDVIAAKQRLAAVRASSAGSGSSDVIAAQISGNRNQIASLQTAKSMMLSQSASARDAASRAPAVSAQIDQLEKQAEVKRDQLRMVGMRTTNADLNAKMETEQKGERLTLADPPVVPDTPFKPNRKVLIAGGASAGVALGLALILAIELILRPIRGVDAVRAATGALPLSIIPDFERKPNWIIRYLERRNRKRADKKARKGRY